MAIPTSDEVIEQFRDIFSEVGLSSTFRKITKGGYDPSTSTTTPDTVENKTVDLVKEDLTDEDIEKGLGTSELKVNMLNDYDFVPSLEHELIYDGTTYAITKIIPDGKISAKVINYLIYCGA